MSTSILKVDSLKKYYPLKKGLFYRIEAWVKAVDGVSFEIEKAKTLGLVGESGCGKTTLGRTILRLLEPDSGKIFFADQEITHIHPRQMRRLREKMQIVFQDPFNSLEPRFTVGHIVGEGLRIFKALSKKIVAEKVAQLLEIVGLSGDVANRYPHEFSGGQRQRIGIARAISLNPAFLVLDEPVSSLDISVQAQIINLLYDLQERLHLSYLFIAHDLNVIRRVSDEVAVMYSGRIVEKAENSKLYAEPKHPYTRTLFEAMPITHPRQRRKRMLLRTEADPLLDLDQGCRFRLRCPDAQDICSYTEPLLKEIGPGHSVACHLMRDGSA